MRENTSTIVFMSVSTTVCACGSRTIQSETGPVCDLRHSRAGNFPRGHPRRIAASEQPRHLISYSFAQRLLARPLQHHMTSILGTFDNHASHSNFAHRRLQKEEIGNGETIRIE